MFAIQKLILKAWIIIFLWMHQQGAYRIFFIPFFVMRYLSQECFKSFGIDFYTTVHTMTMIAIKL